jgi:RNA polymerase primary sigma factor
MTNQKFPMQSRGTNSAADPSQPPDAKWIDPQGNELEDTLSLYMKEVGRMPLLSGEQEVALAKRIERGREARELLAKSRVGTRKRVELRALVEDGWAAREHLLTANSRLVISVAKKYMGRGVPFADLIQEGNIGLIRATKKFEYKRGLKFSTYATWWIRQAVTRAVADQGRTIRLPVHMGDQINRLLRASHKLTQEFGRQPTNHELSEHLQLPLDKIEQMKKVAQLPLSLEMPTNEEEDSVLGDFLEDAGAEAPPEVVDESLMQQRLREALNSLPPRERVALELRYGLADGVTYTLEEVGRKLGVTRERARQIESQALGRLRDPRVRNELVDYFNE